ncbi:MAG: S8 family serine peptidase [Planctomycetota bacterium]
MRWGSIRVALLLGAVGGLSSVGLAQAQQASLWRHAEARQLGAEHGRVETTAQRIVGAAPTARMVVRFAETPNAAKRSALAASGVRLLSPLGDGAYFASIDRAATRTLGVAGVELAEAIRPEWKLHPTIANDTIPAHAIVASRDGADRPVTLVAGYLVFHPDADLQAETDRLIQTLGVTVMDTLQSVNGLVIEAPKATYARLAEQDAVQWLEPALPQFSTTNASNRVVTQAEVAQSGAYGLDGSGVTVLVYDGGMADLHPDFQSRLTQIDSSGLSDHATHVAGTVGSSGTHSGMAPNATLLSAGFEFNGSGTFLYTNPGDLETDYANAISMGADITNNSIGTNTAPNGFPCNFTGDYGVTSSVIDAVVRGSAGEPIIVFWANGNERQTSRCGANYATTAPPACAKNQISIGALNSNNDSVTSFTSWGPTDDGRLKPDMGAPGCQSNGDGGVTSTVIGGGYSSFCGTSMASPTAAGCGALFVQDWRVQYPALDDPRNATVKAIFAHTAEDVQNAGPDYQTGYGSIRIVDAIDHMRLGRFEETAAEQGEAVRYTISVTAGETVRVTAAWDDAPATPNVVRALVNDLDVSVVGPSGQVFNPWTLDAANPSALATQDKANRLDNLEQVLFTAPESGVYTVEVFGHDVPQGPQDVSVVSSHDLSEVTGLDLATSLPLMLAPATPLDVRVSLGGDTVTPGTAFVSFGMGGSFSQIELIDLGGGEWGATLPSQYCDTGEPVELYFEVQGDSSGLVTLPIAGAASPFSIVIGEAVTLFTDDFSSNNGWSVGAPGDSATSGVWELAVPQGTEAQPAGAFSPPNAWITEAAAGGGQGAFDIDGGATTLTSATYDLSGATDPVISYYRWYSNTTGGAPGADTLRIEISNNNGASWVDAETVGPSGLGTTGGWFESGFRVRDAVSLSDQIRVRFVAEDAADGSIVEAAIDDLAITDVVCGVSAPGGCAPADITTESTSNGVPDGLITLSDFSYYLSLWSTGDPAADVTVTSACVYGSGGDGVDLSDFACYLSEWSLGCP